MEPDKWKEALKVYESKRKKYNLPSFTDIQKEFKIPLSSLDPDEKMILVAIRGEISRRISSLAADLESIIAGYDRFCCNVERREFSKDDKKRLFEAYRKLQQFFWEGRLAYDQGEEELAKWLNSFYKAWVEDIKEVVLWYDSKMKEAWKELKNSEADLRYVG